MKDRHQLTRELQLLDLVKKLSNQRVGERHAGVIRTPEQLLHGLGIRHRVVDRILRALGLAAEPGQPRRLRVVRREERVLCRRDLARRRILVKPAARCTVGRVGLLLYRAHIAIGAKSTQRAAL